MQGSAGDSNSNMHVLPFSVCLPDQQGTPAEEEWSGQGAGARKRSGQCCHYSLQELLLTALRWSWAGAAMGLLPDPLDQSGTAVASVVLSSPHAPALYLAPQCPLQVQGAPATSCPIQPSLHSLKGGVPQSSLVNPGFSHAWRSYGFIDCHQQGFFFLDHWDIFKEGLL